MINELSKAVSNSTNSVSNSLRNISPPTVRELNNIFNLTSTESGLVYGGITLVGVIVIALIAYGVYKCCFDEPAVEEISGERQPLNINSSDVYANQVISSEPIRELKNKSEEESDQSDGKGELMRFRSERSLKSNSSKASSVVSDIPSEHIEQNEIDHRLVLDPSDNNSMQIDNVSQLEKAIALKSEGRYQDAIAIFSLLENGSDKPAAQANYHLGLMWQQGLGVDPDEKKANRYFRIAQAKGSAEASTLLGDLLQKQSNYAEAKREYDTAIFQSPGIGSAKAYNRRANLRQHGLGTKLNLDKAIDDYQQSIIKGNNDANIDLGHLYQDQGNYELALDCYQKGEGEAAAQACLELGDLCGEQKKFDLALLCYQAAENKGSADAPIKLGDLSCVNKNYDQAFEHYQRADQKLAAKSFDYLGHLYLESGDIDKAKQCYEIAGKYGCDDAWIHLGDIYKGQGKLAEAFECYKNGQGSNAARACRTLGQLYQTTDDKEGYARAITCFVAALEKGLTEVLIDLGLVYLKQQEFAQAKNYLERAEKEGLVDACVHIGDMYLEQGQYMQAFDVYQRGSNSSAAEAIRQLGHGFIKQGNVAMAFDCFEIADQKGSIEALYDRGCLYSSQGNYLEAAKCFEKIRKSHGMAANSLGKLHLDGHLDKNPDFAMAMSCFEDAVNLGYAKANANIGYLYYKGLGVGKCTKTAFEYFMKGKDAQASSACFYLGEFFQNGIEVKKDVAKAVYWYQLALKLNNQAHDLISKAIAQLKKDNPHLCNAEYEAKFNINYPLAEKGNAKAQFELGVMYMSKENLYVKYSSADAEHYLTSSSKNEHPDAPLKLGELYEARSSFSYANKDIALKWYRTAIDSTNVDTVVEAAKKLVMLGGQQDYEMAIREFKAAAVNASVNVAYKYLGDMHFCGLGTEKSTEKALFYYRKFIGDENVTLEIKQTNSIMKKAGLGDQDVIIFDKKRNATEHELLFETLFPLAEDGKQDAQLQLGVMYLEGRYVEKNQKMAEKYFELGCANNPKNMSKLDATLREGGHNELAEYWSQRLVDYDEQASKT